MDDMVAIAFMFLCWLWVWGQDVWQFVLEWRERKNFRYEIEAWQWDERMKDR